MANEAIDTAARFGEIPFVEFTKSLVTGVFDSLVEAHIQQMQEYGTFLNALTQDLSTYINNTVDNVSFSEISTFLLNYQLPTMDPAALASVMGALQNPAGNSAPTGSNGNPPVNGSGGTAPAVSTSDSSGKWWEGVIKSLGPAVYGLVDKIKDPNLKLRLDAITEYNDGVLGAAIPSYKDIQSSIAALIASNKYALLQNMSKQGMLRLVVTEGEIETKITFSTWNSTESGSSESHSDKSKVKSATNNFTGGGILGLLRGNRSFSRDVNRVVTVNTAKSYQRDSSGTRVDIFGRVLIRFKSDYAPLNG
jgi:hypothetical protein